MVHGSNEKYIFSIDKKDLNLNLKMKGLPINNENAKIF